MQNNGGHTKQCNSRLFQNIFDNGPIADIEAGDLLCTMPDGNIVLTLRGDILQEQLGYARQELVPNPKDGNYFVDLSHSCP